MERIIIGIDADVDFNGVTIMKPDKSFTFHKMTFNDLMNYLDDLSLSKDIEATIVVEAPYLIKKVNFHTLAGAVGQRVSYAVGRNHQCAIMIVALARHFGLDVIEQKPLRHKWKKGKISAEEFNELTGYKGRSNQDCRDSALLALNYIDTHDTD